MHVYTIVFDYLRNTVMFRVALLVPLLLTAVHLYCPESE